MMEEAIVHNQDDVLLRFKMEHRVNMINRQHE